MEQSTQVWVLTSALGIMSIILAFVAKIITTQVLKKLDSIIDELKILQKVTITQEEKLNALKDSHSLLISQLNEHSIEINDHSHRILRLEIASGTDN